MLKGNTSDIQYYRHEMPQIKSKYFQDFLDWSSIRCTKMVVDGTILKPTQVDINEDKVEEMKIRVINKDPDFKGVITVSADGYVLDGHHRWLALINAGEHDIECNILHLCAVDALAKMLEYPYGIRQTLDDSKLV